MKGGANVSVPLAAWGTMCCADAGHRVCRCVCIWSKGVCASGKDKFNCLTIQPDTRLTNHAALCVSGASALAQVISQVERPKLAKLF